MRLSTPLLSALLSRRQHQFPRILRAASRVSHPHYAKIYAPIVFAAASISSLSTTNPVIDDLTKKLDNLAPRFELQKGEIEILTTPVEFYTTLRKKILSAKKRVFLSSLYIGKDETELVNPNKLYINC